MIEIRSMEKKDWPVVKSIYEEGLATGHASFQTTAPEWEAWDAGHIGSCRLVAIEQETVVAWAALSPVSDRCVYGGVAEVSVYVAGQVRGHGIGTLLLKRLIPESETAGFWTLQAGIFPENTASIAIHERNGFRIVGRREKIGRMNGLWRDTILLERRTRIID